jgi:hypothetical protein
MIFFLNDRIPPGRVIGLVWRVGDPEKAQGRRNIGTGIGGRGGTAVILRGTHFQPRKTLQAT